LAVDTSKGIGVVVEGVGKCGDYRDGSWRGGIEFHFFLSFLLYFGNWIPQMGSLIPRSKIAFV
jgi:hypothetical protein